MKGINTLLAVSAVALPLLGKAEAHEIVDTKKFDPVTVERINTEMKIRRVKPFDSDQNSQALAESYRKRFGKNLNIFFAEVPNVKLRVPIDANRSNDLSLLSSMELVSGRIFKLLDSIEYTDGTARLLIIGAE